MEILILKSGKQVQIVKDKAAIDNREIYICRESIMISKKSRMNMHKIIWPYYLYVFLSFKYSTSPHLRKKIWMLTTWRHKVNQVTSDMPPGVSPVPQCGSKGQWESQRTWTTPFQTHVISQLSSEMSIATKGLCVGDWNEHHLTNSCHGTTTLLQCGKNGMAEKQY